MLIKSIDNSPDQCKLLFLPVYRPKSCQIFCKTQLSGVWHVICLITEMVKYLYKCPCKRNGLLLFFTFSGIGAQKIRFYVGTYNSKPQVPVFFSKGVSMYIICWTYFFSQPTYMQYSHVLCIKLLYHDILRHDGLM